MRNNSDLRDQAYQFFIQEAPELLQTMEAGLMTLRQERSAAQVHALMRAAHSIKGGAATVGLEAIKTLAHRLEDIFQALYSEEIEIDPELESWLLLVYDCLSSSLIEQITVGNVDSAQALAAAEPILAQIEQRMGDAFNQAKDYIPSSTELGVDIVKSIFEVDVAQGLERLANVVAHPQDYEVAGELRAQAEVFAGFAELFNLPGFGALAQTAIAALNNHPEQALPIAQLALTDFYASRQAVLAGDRTHGVSPSAALAQLAGIAEAMPAAAQAAAADQSLAEETLELLKDSQSETLAIPAARSLTQVHSLVPASRYRQVQATSRNTNIVSGLSALLLQTGSNLRSPLSAQIQKGKHVVANALAQAQSVFSHLNIQNGSMLTRAGLLKPAQGDENQLDLLPTDVEQEEWECLKQELDEALSAALQEDLFDSPTTTSEVEASDITSAATSQAAAQTPIKLPKAISPATDEQVAPTNAAATKKTTTPPMSGVSSLVPTQPATQPATQLSVRVALERLERMSNIVGEIAINRNSLSLQNEQLQGFARELLARFAGFREVMNRLQSVSDQAIAASERYSHDTVPRAREQLGQVTRQVDFDELEMDRYGMLQSLLPAIFEEVMQLEEAVDDIALLADQSEHTLEKQRQLFVRLRDELTWARMLPCGELLNRFHRVVRELSTTHHKPVNLKLSGTDVLIDKAILERLYEPLLHLVRNAFAHGIESPEVRCQQGKSEQGQIEFRAYYRGNQTIIEVRDDGSGLNVERIRSRALERGLLSAEQLAVTGDDRILELIFEPGFSTASQLSDLSGRGVGLDVVRSQLRALKGTVTVTSLPGRGTTFTFRLPLTLTIAKLLVCLVGSTALALPSDSIIEILIPKAEQIQQSETQRFLRWREQLIPAYRLADILYYTYPVLETPSSKALIAVPSPQDWALPMLILRRDQQAIALEIDHLATEEELVIKPFGSAIAPPSYAFGCAILANGSLVPVIDGADLIDQVQGQSIAAPATTNSDLLSESANKNSSVNKTTTVIKTAQTATVLVVDDSIVLRQTLTFSLQKAGYKVLQARDGWEAIEKLRNAAVQTIICDVEMPNMNGFEFLIYRRQDPQLSDIPVVMLTSRSRDKHRQLAADLGAIGYFTKPYVEQEFLAALKNITK